MSELTDAIHRAVEAAYCEGVDTVKVEIAAIALAEKLEARLAELEADKKVRDEAGRRLHDFVSSQRELPEDFRKILEEYKWELYVG